MICIGWILLAAKGVHSIYTWGGNYKRSLLSSFLMNPSFGVLPLFQQDVNPSLETPREKDFELAVLLAFSLKNAMKYPGS